MEELQIIVAAIIDEIKSHVKIKESLDRIAQKLTVAVTATLDKAKSRRQIKSDLSQIDGQKVDVTAKLNRSESRKALKQDLKSMGNEKVKIKAEIDKTALKRSIKEVTGTTATIDVDTKVNGAEDLDKLSSGLDGINKKSALTVASVSLLNRAFNTLEQLTRKMITNSSELDQQLADTRMVTGASYNEARKLVTQYNELAKSLGATTKDILDASSDWLRQGHDVSETNELIRNSMILSKVSNLEAAEATEYLTSAMKGYKVAVEDVVGIVDKLTAVDLVSATDAGGLAEAMSKTAVSANLAGVEMDKLIGYLAAVGEVSQDSMSSIGHAFKTFFARYSDIKSGKLELIDEDGTTETLSDVEQALENVGIDMRSAITEFDDFDDALSSLAAKWDNLSNIQQSAIAKAYGGTRQKDRFLVLMENYKTAMSYMETAANSTGTAEKKFGAYLESLEAKVESFKAAFESLSMDTFDAQFLGGLVEAGTSLLEFVDSINLLKSALIGLSTAGILKGFTLIADSAKHAYGDVLKLSTAFDIMGKAKGVGVAADQMHTLISVTKGLSEAQLRLVVSNKTLTNQQRMAILTSNGLTKEQAAQTLSTMGLTTAEATATAATFSLSGAIKALSAAIAANPIGFLAVAITAAVSVITTVTDAMEEAKQKAEEYANSLKEQAQASKEASDSIRELIAQYLALSNAKDGAWSASEQKELVGIQAQITDLVGTQAKNLNLVNERLDEEYQKLLSIYNLTAEEAYDDAESHYLAVKQKYEEGYQHERNIWGRPAEEEFLASWYIKRAYEEINGVENTGIGGSNVWWGKEAFGDSYDGNGWLGKIPEALSAIGSYEEGLDKLIEWRDMLVQATELEGFGDSSGAYNISDALAYVNNKIEEYRGVSKNYEDAYNDFQSAKAGKEVLNYLKNNKISSQDDFDAFADNVYNNDSYDKEYARLLIETMQSYYTDFEIPQDIVEAFNGTIAKKRQDILDKIVASDIWQAHNGNNSSFHEQSLMQKMETLSDEELDVVYDAVTEKGISTWNEMLEAIEAYNAEQEYSKTAASQLQTVLSGLWNSEDFADTKKQIQAMATSVTGITAENVERLATESENLAAILEMDGMNAQFLAHILQTMEDGGDGLALITNDALELNEVLDGMVDSFDNVTAAKARYDAAMSADEKDTNFKSYAEAFEALNEEFKAGTTNSNAFWAAAEYLFGSEQLSAWGWRDGLDEIYQAMEANRSVFKDADSAGAGFIERLYQMDKAGKLVNEQGEKLLEISKTANDDYKFDVEPENIAAIADAMDLTEEAVLACFQALSMWGNVNFYDIVDVVGQLEKMNLIADAADGKAVNFSRLTEQLLALGKTNLEIADLTSALQNQGVTLLAVTDNVDTLTTNLQKLGLAANDGVTIAVDYEGLGTLISQIGFTKEEASNLITTLGNADGISLANASGEVQDVTDALAYIDTLTFDTVTTNIDGVSSAIGDVNESSTDNAVSELSAVGSAAETAATKVYSIGSAIDSIDGKSCTVTYNVERKGNLLSMFGFAKGTNDAPAGEALVGEEGVELWQSGNKARLVGVNGPEIVNLNKGDRIYPNPMTKKMLSKSGKRLSGTIPAYAGGTINGAVTGSINTNTNKTGSTGTKRKSSSSGKAVNEFEELYKKHQHLLAMDQESVEDYLAWLNSAYKKAYKNGKIDLDDYRKYQKEVYSGMQDLFMDYLNDDEHQISMLDQYENNDAKIIGIYRSMMSKIEKEIAAARKAGMDDNDEYIQKLQSKWMDYFDAIADRQEEVTEAAKDATDELVDFRVDMLKQELEDEKDALDERLDNLGEFYDKQKEMLQDQYDQEKYIEQQAEKRKTVSDIQTELDQLKFDDSAWAKKRKLELEEELSVAQKDLDDFEEENALDQALDFLDEQYERQEALIQKEIEAIDAKLNDPHALFNQALNDIRNNTKALYDQMVAYNNQYGDGNPETVKEMWENSYIAFKEYGNLFGSDYKGIDLNNATGYKFDNQSLGNSQASGKNSTNQSNTTSSGSKNQSGTKPSLTKGSSITVKKSATHYSSKSGSEKMASFVPGGKYTVYRTSGNEVLIGRDGVYTGWINKTDIEGYASGTRNATAGLHKIFENGDEYIFSDQGNGKYRLFSNGEKVLDAESTNFLHDFASKKGIGIVDKIIAGVLGSTDNIAERIAGSAYSSEENLSRMTRNITDNRVINNNVDMSGDINIQGNANEKTVSDIRREQRETVQLVLKEINKLGRTKRI